MPTMRAIPSLLVVAAFVLSGAAPLCACLSMQHEREMADQHANMPPCCAPQQEQQPPACPSMPAPDGDTDSEMPDDCPHCQMQSTEMPRADERIAAPPTSRDQLDLALDLDFNHPLPIGLVHSSVTFAPRERRAERPPAPRADTLLARACLLTL